MGREALAAAIRELSMDEDMTRRDQWLTNGLRSSSILVGDDVTLADVHRWLKKAVNEL